MPQPIVFISHNSRDDKFAKKLDQDLRDAGAVTWLDKEDAPAGEFQDRINAALSQSEWFVLVLTPNALQSDWVKREVNSAIILKQDGQIHEIIFIQAEPVEERKIDPFWRGFIRLDASTDYAFALDQTLKSIGLRPGRKHEQSASVFPRTPRGAALRIGLARALFVVAILLLFAGAMTAVTLEKGSLPLSIGAFPLEGVIAVLGVVTLSATVAVSWLTPAGATANSLSSASRQLFIALKQSRDMDGRRSDPRRWPELIPLTLRDDEDPLSTAGRSIQDVYQVSHDLLILGKPGSGKTTLLQQFALDFMDEEIHHSELSEVATRLPVLLSLHEWAKRKRPLHTWIAQQFKAKFDAQGLSSVYGLSRSLVNVWIRQGAFILLLDGLDEMNEEDSKACIAAINRFRRQSPASLIIGCELSRYQRLVGESHTLNVGQKPVVVQGVTPRQAQVYFEKLGATRLANIAGEETANSTGRLPDTPLMLNVVARTYPDDSPKWGSPASPVTIVDMSEDTLMKQFVISVVGAHPPRYGGKDVRYWLTQLANHMENTPYFRFRAEDLPSATARTLYVISTWLVIALLAAAACLPVAIGAFPPWQLLTVLALIAGLYGYLQLLPVFAFIPGLYGFLVKSAVTGLFMLILYVLTLALPFFAFASSSKKTFLQKLGEVAAALVTILLPAVLLTFLLVNGAKLIGMPAWLGILCACWIGGLLWYVLYRLRVLQFLLQTGSKTTVLYTWLTVTYMMIVRLVEPFASARLSPRASTLLGMAKGLAPGLVAGLIVWSSGRLVWHTDLLLAAILVGASVWLDRGLGASLRGYILRFWFLRYRMLPWSARFLDDAVALGLLQAQGDGYGFVFNDTLKNYFRGGLRE